MQVDTIGDTSALADGASYDVAGDAWTTLPAPPSALSAGRMYPAAVYGAGQLLVWGGSEGGSATSFTVKATGARYDSTAATWSPMSSTGAPSARSLAGAVWATTTSQMIVWGGCTAIDTFNTCTAFSASGAAYDPAKDTWTALPAAPPGFEARANHSRVWTGSDVVIWGGGTDAAAYRNGARYNPTTKLWTTVPTPPTAIVGRLFHVSVTSGTELLVYGGSDATQSTAYDTGARYLPGGSWTAFAVPGAAELPTTKRFNAQGWYGGGKLYVWSGFDDLFTGLANGASYDPVADKWTAMDSKGAPAARAAASVVWTGKEAFVWGGIDASTLAAKADGAIFRP